MPPPPPPTVTAHPGMHLSAALVNSAGQHARFPVVGALPEATRKIAAMMRVDRTWSPRRRCNGRRAGAGRRRGGADLDHHDGPQHAGVHRARRCSSAPTLWALAAVLGSGECLRGLGHDWVLFGTGDDSDSDEEWIHLARSGSVPMLVFVLPELLCPAGAHLFAG